MAKYSRTNLIINYLPQAFSDEEFRALFGSVAPVKRAKVCRDKRSGYSFGFGFCEFYTPEDANRAVRMLNGLQLHRKTIKVAHARLQSSESKNCNLHLTNLPPSVTADEIRSVLEPYGGIINCKILPGGSRGGGGGGGGSGSSRGVGFCLFETRSAATAALAALNGKPWPGATGLTDNSQAVQVRFADENEKKVRPPALVGGSGALACSSVNHQQPLLQQQPPPPPPMPQPPSFPLPMPPQLPHHPLSLVPPPPPPPPPQPLMPPAYDFSGSGGYYSMQQQQAQPAHLPPPPPSYAAYPSLYPSFPGFHCPTQYYPTGAPSDLPAPPPPPPLPTQPTQAAFFVSVCNLPPSTDEHQLWSMFAQFGSLADIRLEPGSGRQPAPAEGDLQPPGASAVAAFAAYQSAVSAVSHWNGQTVDGRQLQVWLRLP